MFLRFLNMVLFFLIAMAIQGQQYNKKDFKVYRSRDGLSNNFINAITQDAYGYIWVGTDKGLNRFDGSHFQQFYSDSLTESLPEDRVFNLKWINNEELGVLTSSGLHIINSKTLEMHNLLIPADSLKHLSFFNSIFDVAADKKENIFIITFGGFYHFNNNRLVFRYDHYSNKQVENKGEGFGMELVQVSDSTLLLSTMEGLYIYKIEKKDLHPLGKMDDPFFHLIAPPKQMFRFTYNDENYFSAKFQNEFALFDIQKRTKQTINFNSSANLYRLNDTLMAVTSMGNGFYMIRRNKQTGSWILDTKPYFENDYCTSLLIDKNNLLWVGTSDGLYKQNRLGERVAQTQLSNEEFSIQKTITGIAVANNKVFVATVAEGLYVFDSDSLQFLQHVIHPERQNFIIQLLKVNEDSLMSAGNGFVINTRNLQYKKLELGNKAASARINVLLRDSHNRIYFTKYRTDTVYFKDPSDKSFSAIPLPELQKIRTPNQMAQDNEGNIWFGGQGLIRLNNQTKKIDLFLDSFPSIKRGNKTISSNMVFDRSDRIYFGIDGNGLIIYDVKEKKFYHLTRDHGLPDNLIRVLYLHENKTLWIATDNGLASYDLDRRKVSAFGVSDGMPTDPGSCTALYYDTAHNHLYAAFTPHIVRFDPTKLKKNQIPPAFFIESIDIKGKELLYHPGDVITVPYKYNSVTINLAAINFEDASQQLFAYRFVKQENDGWQEIGQQRRVYLNDLPVGKHKLQIKVYIRNQSWPDQTKEIILIVKPPFWKTIWFYIAIGLLIATTLFYLHRRRIDQLTQKARIDKQLAQTEMKALHSQMNPHFIFNCLNSIREMILNNENEQASLYLSKFARLIRITLNHSSKTFVSLEDTIDYLQRYLEMEQIRKSNFTYSIEVDNDLQRNEILLPPMLIQPFIENAIWHGAAPDREIHLRIKFKRKQNELICIVEDDGIGIETSLKNKESDLGYKSVGIANIRQRIQVLNEKYNLQSTVEIKDKSSLSLLNARLPDGQGTGTIVTLHLTIKPGEPFL